METIRFYHFYFRIDRRGLFVKPGNEPDRPDITGGRHGDGR
jgi:hypothetical protein